MIKTILISSIIFLGHLAMAGGNSDSVTIKNITYKSSGAVIVEFENLSQDKHFMSIFPKDIKKLRFQYMANANWIKRALTKEDRSKQFEDCINWMIQNYKSGTSFQLGQMGGGEFKLVEDSKDEVIIPFIYPDKTRDGKEQVCLIDLG